MIDTLFELQQQVIDGNANALEAYINLKKLEKALATVIANVQPYEHPPKWLWTWWRVMLRCCRPRIAHRLRT